LNEDTGRIDAVAEVDGTDILAKAAAVPVVAKEKDLFSRNHDGSYFEYFDSIDEDKFDQILKWAGDRKASDVRFQTDLPVMADIGGKKVPITRKRIGQPEIERIVRYVYGEHGPGMIIAGYDLDPSHEVRLEQGKIYRYRVNFTGIRVPGGRGISATIRTLPTMPPLIEDLGIEAEIMANLRPRQGMVLVTGPTGSGKSTLLAAIVRHIAEKPDANEAILEYSSPIEYVYDGIDMPSSIIAQTEVGTFLRNFDDESMSAQYAHAVRNSLRRKPDIILIGEARDKATIQASVEAALTGHLLYSTLHVVGVPETLRRIVTPFPGDEREAMGVDIMQSMRMVVTQLLFDRVGGGKVACREFMIFDDRTRASFLAKPVNTWPAMARRLMAENRVPCSRMSNSAWKLLEKGLISRDTFKGIVESERDKA
jgi:defect-in-organelle-trafficking protein DotB